MKFCCKRVNSNIHIPNFVLNDETISRVSKHKYLKHVITGDFSDNDDMSRQYKIIYNQSNALIRKFYICKMHFI